MREFIVRGTCDGSAELVKVTAREEARGTQEQEEDQSFNSNATESNVSEKGVPCQGF